MANDVTRKKAPVGSPDPYVWRDIDPDVLQRRASSPDSSVWVGASAGSGKTKVLTDRVLRLLLPRDDGRRGTPPDKILCITFTKAAASEMALRISKTLGMWAVLPEDGTVKKTLTGELKKLLGRAPKKVEIAAARRLLAEVTDAPGGMKIMTIHSFCASVLGRFPLEAGISPHFTALEEQQAKALMGQARDAILKTAMEEKAGPLAEALHEAAGVVNDERFLELIRDICGERFQLQQLFDKHFGPEGLYAALCQMLSIRPGLKAEDVRIDACEDNAFAKADLKSAAQNMAAAKAQMRSSLAQGTLEWLALDVKARAAGFDQYCGLYLTQEGNPNSKIFTEAFARDNPQEADIFLREAERLINVKDRMNAAACANLTRALFVLGQAILEQYQALKNTKGVLDFDDLIITTLKLLQQKDMTAWVLYKLDQGLDHILIDEAQDTNPEQWSIALSLAREFFAGVGARQEERTTFTVGDEKQSIYSFQRASPQKFQEARNELEGLVKGAGKNWENIPFNFSFRSTISVLASVDSTYSDPPMHQGMGADQVIHNAMHRSKQAGLVEIWPLCETEKGPEEDPWDPPVRIIEQETGAAKLASKIAHEIKGWIGKEILPSRGRVIQPDDILILVRTRTAFVPQLARELKKLNIPVSGVDRMILNEQLAVRDMLTAAEFALLPSDDLTLAILLKSPLIGWDDDQLYSVAHARTGTLWEALQESKNVAAEIAYLKSVCALAGALHPYEFFSFLLQRPCPADSISGLRAFKKRLGADALDPLEELLNAALHFEKDNIASLQGFLHWQARETEGLKRSMDESRGEVRIMTIHGAKGLQAPIVILPDTIRSSKSKNDSRLLWPDRSGLDVPLWCPGKDLEFSTFTQTRTRIEERQEDEYRRLLYVAMTRAEDRLYVCGYTGKRSIQAAQWYDFIKAGVLKGEGAKTLENGVIRLKNEQIGDPDKAHTAARTGAKAPPAPSWLHSPAPAEPNPPQPLIPSRPSEGLAPVLSPLANEGTYRFKRGNMTHKLLELLPDLPVHTRTAAAKTFTARQGGDLPPAIIESVIRETLAILQHPDLAALFGPDSQAEVPITGLMPDGRVISGQIDRLLITDSAIHIIDYKTNRPPPTDPKDVPQIYMNQMKAYADTLRAIYPGREIRASLLWTDGPRLMTLDV